MSMFEDIPVEVGVIYEGERIRRKNMQVELGGPKQEHKFELARVRNAEVFSCPRSLARKPARSYAPNLGRRLKIQGVLTASCAKGA